MTQKRVKIVLPVDALHRLLGLSEDVRVVGVYATADPAAACVLIEGEGVPETAGFGAEQLAAMGVLEAPRVWHPIRGSEDVALGLTWGAWKLGDTPMSGDALRPSVAGFDSEQRRPDPREAARLVFEALGAASVCWETPSGAGEFDSRRAAKVGRELLEALGFEVPEEYRGRG